MRLSSDNTSMRISLYGQAEIIKSNKAFQKRYETYLDENTQLTDDTKKTYKNSVSRFCKWANGEGKNIASSEDHENYLNYLDSQNYSKKHILGTTSILKLLMKFVNQRTSSPTAESNEKIKEHYKEYLSNMSRNKLTARNINSYVSKYVAWANEKGVDIAYFACELYSTDRRAYDAHLKAYGVKPNVVTEFHKFWRRSSVPAIKEKSKTNNMALALYKADLEKDTDMKKNTRKTYKNIVSAYGSWATDTAADIANLEIRDSYLDYLESRGKSQSCIASIKSTLKHFDKWIEEHPLPSTLDDSAMGDATLNEALDGLLEDDLPADAEDYAYSTLDEIPPKFRLPQVT